MQRKKQFTKGCFNKGIKSYVHGNIKFHTCLGNYTDNYYTYLWQLFTHYENNLLPYKGSIGEQPAKFIEVMDIIKSLVSEHEEKLKQANKIKQKGLNKLGK